jgi:large conductance mechanosensitive channel
MLIALAIFVMVKIINELRRRYEDQPPAATPPRQEMLLEEIRDLLKRR